ncbi:MAG: YicC/YloC family endoribonuclease, partial [Acidobacteriaceae bacterium]
MSESPIRSQMPIQPQSPIRSMTGFARHTGTAPGNVTFVLTLKSVNHRYLDLQFYLPTGMDALEMLWRKTIKEHMVRGHIEVRLSVQRAGTAGAPQYNPAMVQAYI